MSELLHGPLRERKWYDVPYTLADCDLDHMLGFEAIYLEPAPIEGTEQEPMVVFYAAWACPVGEFLVQSRGPIAPEVVTAFLAPDGPAVQAGFEPRIACRNARVYRAVEKLGIPVCWARGVN